MLIGPQNLAANLAAVRSRIAACALASGRSDDSITLVAVSKGQPVESVRLAMDLGQWHFGENYPQEATAKIEAIDRLRAAGAGPSPPETERGSPQWHFIGQIQSNKTRVIASRFDWVHGIDRVSVARRLSEHRSYHAPPLNVFLQVKLVDEPAKAGVATADLYSLAAEVASLPRLQLRGLMCIPPPTDNVDEQRGYFRQMRELLEKLRSQGLTMDGLSMGMSTDYEVAIQEGATHVRVGTAIFGPRASETQAFGDNHA